MAANSEIGRTRFSTPSDREIVITRVFDAPRWLVWAAWTDPQHVPQWLLGPDGWTMPVCEIDLRPGGAWHFLWRNGNGEELDMHGVYREVVPPARLVNTERWGEEWPETLNTLELSEENGKTTVVQTALYPSREARDAALQTGMNDGVARSYEWLDEQLRRMA